MRLGVINKKDNPTFNKDFSRPRGLRRGVALLTHRQIRDAHRRRTMFALSASTGYLGLRSLTARANREQSASMQAQVALPEDAPVPPSFDVKSMAGVTAPLGFFDPAGFSNDASEGKIRFYREVELKHGRVAMLASLGYVVAEQFHPLWGGTIDVPSFVAFQATPLQTFWPAVMFVLSVFEVFSVFSFGFRVRKE